MQTPSLWPGQRPAQSQMHAKCTVLTSLLYAAGEGMDNTAVPMPNALQGAADIRVTAARMNNDRQIRIASQVQLGFK